MSEPNPTEALIAQLDQQLAAMAERTSGLREDYRVAATAAVAHSRAELAAITTPQQLTELATRYRATPPSDPVTTGLRTQLLARIDSHLTTTQPAPAVNVSPTTALTTAPTPTPTPTQTAPSPAPPTPTTPAPKATASTVRQEGLKLGNTSPQPVAARSVPSSPPNPVERHEPQNGDLVVFRNGDQNRWGIVDHRPRDASFVLRVGGIPHAVPAVNITHTIDPRQQPDLPLDTVLDGERLRVRRVHWGDDAERLQALAKGRPAMQRLGHVTDGFDLRDGIGTNNERADPSTRRDAMAHDRSDQQPDVDFVRSNPGRSTRATPTPGVAVQRLPTAGPNAMGWSANLDNTPAGQTRIIVTGSRDLTPDAFDTIKATLQRELANVDPAKVTIVHGAAKGADRLAAQAARELGMRTEAHRADWDTHGKAAGPIRNQQMLDAGAQRVIAFVDKPLDQSRGTADMVGRARNAAIPATVIDTQTLTAVPVPATPAPLARAMR